MLIILLTFVVVVLGIVSVLILPNLSMPRGATRDRKVVLVDAWLQRLYKQEKFHGVVLLASSDEVIFEKGYGFADSEERKALTSRSVFNLASVSKQFTAAGIMLLEMRGQLSYTDEIGGYIPELAFYKGVTIAHLLHHTSGMSDYLSIVSRLAASSEVMTAERVVAVYAKNQPICRFQPGKKFEYCNMGYVLLAVMIERISGQAYSDYMRKNIFEPCGMAQASVLNPRGADRVGDELVCGFRRRYFLCGQKQPYELSRLDGIVGDGGICASAQDLLQWHNALSRGDLMPMEALTRAYQSGYLANGKKTHYGYGWFLKGKKYVEHAGGWQGFATYIARDIEKDQLIVVLDNTNNILRVTSNGTRQNAIPLILRQIIDAW